MLEELACCVDDYPLYLCLFVIKFISNIYNLVGDSTLACDDEHVVLGVVVVQQFYVVLDVINGRETFKPQILHHFTLYDKIAFDILIDPDQLIELIERGSFQIFTYRLDLSLDSWWFKQNIKICRVL